MPQKVKVSGAWHDADPYVNVGGTWKLADDVWNKSNGKWYTSFVKGGLADRSWNDVDQTSEFGTNANNTIYQVALQSDGKILVCGTFTSWNGTTVGYIARVNSDGTLDTAFTTNNGTGANSAVRWIALQSDGKILVGGQFTSWNGTTVGRLVRLNSDGTLDTAFTTNNGTGANNHIFQVTLQSDGKILIGGNLTSWNGTTVGRLVRLNSDGTLDTAFTTNTGTGANSTVWSVAQQSDGKILFVGAFTLWNGTTVNRIARLNSDGTLDTAFTTNTGTGANSTTYVVALQSDGKILVGGNFTLWNGTTVGRIARLNSDGTLDTAFTTNTGTGANSTIWSFVQQSDGKILFVGAFGTWNGTTVGRIVRLNSDGTLDTTFMSNLGTGASTTVYHVELQSDGKIIIGGGFQEVNGVLLGRIARLNSDGTGESLLTFANSTVRSVALQSDGKILVGGQFSSWNGTTVGRIVRLNSDGTHDTAFTTNNGTGANAIIYSVALQSDGKILLGGELSSWNGTTVGRLVRLNSDGTLDTTFMSNLGTGASSGVVSLVQQSDGKIIAGGAFMSWNGTTVGRIVRLNSDGTLDTAFTTNNGTGANDTIYSVALQSDGKIIIGGGFDNVNGLSTEVVARLNSNGSLQVPFGLTIQYVGSPSFTSARSVVVQPDGKIVVSGSYLVLVGGLYYVEYGILQRFNSDGSSDTAFSSNTGNLQDAQIETISLQPNGKIIVGGTFISWNGTAATYIARVDDTGVLDTAFVLNANNVNGVVWSVASPSNSKMLVGGNFTTFGPGENFRRRLVRIGGERAA